jgi:hypothetical protein
MHGIAGTHGGRNVLVLNDHLHRCCGQEDPCGLTWRHAKVGHVIACLKVDHCSQLGVSKGLHSRRWTLVRTALCQGWC